MQLEHSFSVPIGIDEAWRTLIDIERIAPCMPGAAVDAVDGDQFTGTVKVKLGPLNLTYKGEATFLEKDEAARRVVLDARGRDARGNGTAAAKVTATMHEDGGASTTVTVQTDLDMTGKPAQFGRAVMVDVGNRLLGQFAEELAKTVGAGDAPAAPAAETAAEPAAVMESVTETVTEPAAVTDLVTEPASAGESGEPVETAADVAAATAVAESTAADLPSADAITTGAAASGPAPSAADSAREVEPIDLLPHARPAVAKRLAPVAVAMVVVLIAVRRHRRG